MVTRDEARRGEKGAEDGVVPLVVLIVFIVFHFRRVRGAYETMLHVAKSRDNAYRKYGTH